MAYVAVRWGPPEQPRGVVRAALPRTRIQNEEKRGRNRLLLAVIGASVFAAVLATIAARRVSAPITRIQKAAREIASGRMDLRVEPAGTQEVQDLARAINNLAQSVQSQLQAAISEERRLERLLNEMPEGILVVDQAGRLVLVNASARAFLGLSADVIGRTPVEAIRHAELQMAVDRTALSKEAETIEIRVAEPQIRVLSITLLPMDRDMVIVLHDVTRLRRLEEARRETAANIGHELRTPLSAVLGYVETLRQAEDLSAEDRLKFLQVIDRNARRLERLVTDLTQLSRLESSEMGLSFTSLAPGDLVARAVESVTPRAGKKNIAIQTRIPEDLPHLTGDRHILETALLNLMDNAIRVSPAGSAITVAAGRTDGGIRFEVSDHGPGIPREFQDRIFERFYRIDPGRSLEDGGSGLGLAIVKHAVLQHMGRVGVESSPGRGATFYFIIPETQG
jgi:two-component system phosphate regulon sensor histidine kinase PhoR